MYTVYCILKYQKNPLWTNYSGYADFVYKYLSQKLDIYRCFSSKRDRIGFNVEIQILLGTVQKFSHDHSLLRSKSSREIVSLNIWIAISNSNYFISYRYCMGALSELCNAKHPSMSLGNRGFCLQKNCFKIFLQIFA